MANIVDLDQTAPQKEGSDPSLQCLLKDSLFICN